MTSRRYQRDVARLDAWSDRYDRSWLQRVVFGPVHAHVGAVAGQAVPQARTVLDLGCGTGRLLQRLARAYPTARLVGVDAALGVAHVAARRHRIAAVFGSPSSFGSAPARSSCWSAPSPSTGATRPAAWRRPGAYCARLPHTRSRGCGESDLRI